MTFGWPRAGREQGRRDPLWQVLFKLADTRPHPDPPEERRLKPCELTSQQKRYWRIVKADADGRVWEAAEVATEMIQEAWEKGGP
jgi:hypothetical protein